MRPQGRQIANVTPWAAWMFTKSVWPSGLNVAPANSSPNRGAPVRVLRKTVQRDVEELAVAQFGDGAELLAKCGTDAAAELIRRSGSRAAPDRRTFLRRSVFWRCHNSDDGHLSLPLPVPGTSIGPVRIAGYAISEAPTLRP
jgi:hypothetical protein